MAKKFTCETILFNDDSPDDSGEAVFTTLEVTPSPDYVHFRMTACADDRLIDVVLTRENFLELVEFVSPKGTP